MAEPYCLAMVICDYVHVDVATNKRTVIGTFSTLAVQEFPAEVAFFVYCAITDGLGTVPISLKIVDSAAGISDDASPGHANVPLIEAQFESPLVVLELSLPIQLNIPNPGVYHCELYAAEQLLMSRRIIAVDASQGFSDE